MKTTPKKITECYLYNKLEIDNKKLVQEIAHGERLNKNTTEFVEDVALTLKRNPRIPAYLVKVLNSSNTVLLVPKEPFQRPIKVLCAKDISTRQKDFKVFIDTSGVIRKAESNNRYKVQEDVLLAYLISAKTNMVYYKLPKKLLDNTPFMLQTAQIYAKLFTHLIDYIGNISVISGNREKLLYHTARFFFAGVCRLDIDEDRANDLAAQAAGISNTEYQVFNIITKEDDYKTLPEFIDLLKRVFKLDKLTLSLVVEKWMYLYGPGTVLGMEFLPSLMQMVTDAYCGVYLNNQKTIEKVLNKDLIGYGKTVIYDNTGIR